MIASILRRGGCRGDESWLVTASEFEIMRIVRDPLPALHWLGAVSTERDLGFNKMLTERG